MYKLDEPIGVYEETQARINVAAEVQTFVGRRVPRGCILHVKGAAITNLVTEDTMLALGKQDSSNINHWLKQRQGTKIYTCHLMSYPILKAGEKPIARVTTPTEDDDLYFTVYGWLYKPEK